LLRRRWAIIERLAGWLVAVAVVIDIAASGRLLRL
jgi:hypothetical protein